VETLMDEMDRAQGHNEDFQSFALHHQQKNREPGNYTGELCLDCEEIIPVKRRQAVPGCRRCISCQEEFEIHLHWRSM
jgi:phage/conjugal plasmid C-4 type zinc finger TraR family protein